MKSISLFLIAVCFSFFGFSQTTKIDGISFKLPKNWISDPFSTSSVCNCPGIIIIDDEDENNSLWIAVYSIGKDEEVQEDHNFVWDYEFTPEGDGPEVLTVDDVTMHAMKGSYISEDGESYPGYKITSAKGKTSKSFDHIIHIYASNDLTLSSGKVGDFVKSIKWK
ncbi:MAG: hypothetical protein NXI10_01910 [bacterium]|nr:hypothetical protein [bacterium]